MGNSVRRKVRQRKKPRKFLIRRLMFFSSIFILLLIVGVTVFKLINSNNNKSYRNKFEKHYSESQLNEMQKELNIQEVAYKWTGELKDGNNPERIIIHHSATSKLTPEAAHKSHSDKGWSGIGYHFIIRKNGTIYRGRKENIIGAHARGGNYNTLGICLEGNFEEEKLGDAQKKALIDLSTYLSLKYDIRDILGHRDVYETLCPGTKFPFNNVKESIINNIKNI